MTPPVAANSSPTIRGFFMPRRHNRRPPIRKKYSLPNNIPLVELYQRDNGICQWKMHPISLEEATRDHLIPRALGGRNGHNFENVVLMCMACNKEKGRDIAERVA